ncbi:dolichol-phosphate mannosyltransferase [Capnocytophaga haemolytica]|uniref:Dolichyl-phosphate beta-D-mannosyltransferase n=1 Tax=Capnocytophaga haemolytica TaxID=45243 RepID=A0AAX2GZ25_9FLAO|nr:polyprenol monophosphomannose synthase [Capnocytophaga haemolytica]AMD84841.1 dolichyl-phosphate beta-D-mannosyltransferase [Capnocytophaga haemolytica]SFN76055.1 dolichol-phosphate mannosyltransferase [Capnocytophaga haemolytica]SNV06920.1 N-glycosyltransferase [Capnocytophaga haemolytica]
MLVIIPTYNEIENIEAIIRAVLGQSPEFSVLIVDDNSPDGTAAKVQELIPIYNERLHLEVRTEKKGLGTAYVHGFQWALTRNYEYICEMDADFSHNPADLLRLYEECKVSGSDVAIGSRYIKGVNVVNWPLRRILLSYGASMYVRIITGMRIQDPTAGFVCYKRRVLEEIDLNSIRFVGYAFQIEMKYRAYKKHFKITEVPIVFTDRIRGKSKMNGSIIKEAMWGVIRIAFS